MPLNAGELTCGGFWRLNLMPIGISLLGGIRLQQGKQFFTPEGPVLSDASEMVRARCREGWRCQEKIFLIWL
jgi:hypothetical protein